MLRWILSLLAVATLAMGSCLANGGGYQRGGVRSTGAIEGFEPRNTEDIRIVDEDLLIELNRDSVDVVVKYLFRNESDTRVKARFGFPVEELAEKSLFGEDEPKERAKVPEYLKNYRIWSDAEGLKTKFEVEPEGSGEGDERFVGLKGWMVSTVAFEPGEERRVRISYSSDYSFSVHFISENESLGAKEFRYRLSTGGVWKEPITKGRVVVRAGGVDPEEVRVLAPVNQFKRQGADWVWEFEDLEPTLADDLRIEAVPGESIVAANLPDPDTGAERFVRVIERRGRWSVQHAYYSVVASSMLAPSGELTYGPENVADRNPATAWSEGAQGSGVGEWLEIQPDVARPLISILVTPGYAASEELFRLNARPRRVEVELNGEYRFDAVLEDQPEEQTILVSGYSKPVSKVRLTITEVTPGERDEDLCISSVRFEARLDGKPDIRPSR